MTPQTRKCTARQREEIERRADQERMTWPMVLERAGRVTNRTIRDTGELSIGEASELIDLLGEV